jgi:multiple sugar transport system permease protein
LTSISKDGAAGIPVAPSTPKPKKAVSLSKKRGRAGFWFVMPWIVGFFLWYAIPIVTSLWISFTDFQLVTNEPTRFVGLANWERMFNDPLVRQSVGVTLKYGLIALPLSMIFPITLAYILVSRNLRGRESFRALFFLPSIIPFVAAVLIFGGMFNPKTGWVNRILAVFGITGPDWFYDTRWVYPSLAFIGLWGVGNAMLIFIASMNSVPTSLYDAARIDGASELRTFWHITMPIISPIIFYNLILVLIGVFNYFLVPYVLNNGTGAPNGATNFYALQFFKQGFKYFDMSYAATLAWALFIVALTITGLVFWSAKYWVYYEARRD